jgi:hypothetical protein
MRLGDGKRWHLADAKRTVNSVRGMTDQDIVFNRVIYRPTEGFPIENELIANTTDAVGCCVACLLDGADSPLIPLT